MSTELDIEQAAREQAARRWWLVTFGECEENDVDEYLSYHPVSDTMDRYKHLVAFHKHMLSLPQQDVGADRSVPSPVGQQPTFTEAQVKAMRVAGLDIEEVRKAFNFIKESGERHPATPNDQTIALHNIVKWANHGLASIPPTTLFTHPPKAGMLTDEELQAFILTPNAEGQWTGLAVQAVMKCLRYARDNGYLSPKP